MYRYHNREEPDNQNDLNDLEQTVRDPPKTQRAFESAVQHPGTSKIRQRPLDEFALFQSLDDRMHGGEHPIRVGHEQVTTRRSHTCYARAADQRAINLLSARYHPETRGAQARRV